MMLELKESDTRWIRDRSFCLLGIGLLLSVFFGCSSLRSVDLDQSYFPSPEAPNYHQLVSVHWLKALLDFQESREPQERPPSYDNNHFVILEASWATLEKAGDYLAGHVPGAIHLNTDDFENGSPRWRLRSVSELQEVIGKKGITPESTVIVYSEQLIAAARVWWVLKYAGVADVRLLDGGFDIWKAAGYPVETTIPIPSAVRFEAPAQEDWLATTEYVAAKVEGGEMWLGDVRSKDEYEGAKSGYSYLNAKGRIPGAVHLGNADDKSGLYSQRSGLLRAPSEIMALWHENGVLPTAENQQARELILYCGGGWRSSLAFFYGSMLGFQNIRNYSDGWSGWSTVYQEDANAKGRTPGWRQIPTGNPVELEEP